MSLVSRSHTPSTQPLADRYAHVMSDVPAQTFADLIRTAREDKGWNQEQLAQATRGPDGEHVSVSTISRWERGQAGRPEPSHVRMVCKALGIDPRRAAVALGYLTAEEVDQPRPATLDPEVEHALAMLEDGTLTREQRQQWIAYLKWMHAQARRHAS